MANKEEDRKIIKLTDAIASLGRRVNLIGVVTETTHPNKSKGTDYFVSIKIVDQSWSRMPFVVTVFTETMEKLPHVSFNGDIVMFRHVARKKNTSNVYLFNKKFSSFALFNGKIGASFVPYQQSTKFTAREQDKKFITGLRKWLTDHPIGTGSHKFKCLSEIKEESCNLLCKILHISEVQKDECVLFVWDGTDAPPVHVMSKLKDEIENPLPLCLESSLSRDVLCSFPSLGTVLRINFNQCTEKFGINFLKSGKWARFVNVNCVTRFGLWHAEPTPFTRLCYLLEDNETVLKHIRKHEERLSGKLSWMPSTCFPWHSNLTETVFPKKAFASLMHLLTFSRANAKFRCVVRVVAINPWEVDKFRSSDGIYRMRFTLEDPTARIHAILSDDEEVRFFDDHDSQTSLTTKRNKLLGISETPGEVEDVGRNPPWVDICLRPYCTDKNDKLKNRIFCIYGTKFVG